MPRRLLLALTLLLVVFAVVIEASGGFTTTISGVRVSARSPALALTAALLLTAIWFARAYRNGGVRSDLAALDAWVKLHYRTLVGVVSVVAFVIAMSFHTVSANGADASGYLSYARTLLRGSLVHHEPLAAAASWPGAAAGLSPLGWRGEIGSDVQVPTYAIGLPLLLLPWLAAGGVAAAAMVSPLAFAVLTMVTAALASRVAGASAALGAAVWIASSPVALLHAMQFMSDVPVTAAWLLAWLLGLSGRPLAAGTATALAILIRPNLAPLAALPLLFTISSSQAARTAHAAQRWRNAALFSLPVVTAGVIVGTLQSIYFGSAFRSGYGTAEELFTWQNVVPNAQLYLSWLLDTHGPLLLFAPAALLLPHRDVARVLPWLFAFAALVVLSYLVYAQFETWTYLRFLLPALSVAAIAVAALAATLLERAPRELRVIALLAVLLLIVHSHLTTARRLGVFRIAAQQARARLVGERLAATLPQNTVLISGEQSGALRFYSGRSIVRWDLTDANVLPQAIARLRDSDQHVWIVLDDWEEEAFRRKFPEVATALNVPPLLQSASGVGIRTSAWMVPPR